MHQIENQDLFNDLKDLIEQSRARTANTVNSELTALYWRVGKRINSEVLHSERAEYGKQVLPHLSRHLTERFGTGWSRQHLFHCMRFAETFPDESIVSALRRQLSWTHFKALMYIDDTNKRDFYIEMTKNERWSTRVLQNRIKGMLFERTAISKNPEETIENDLLVLRDEGIMTPDLVFRDPYFLDYLGLRDSYSEKDLENAILAELQRFIIELGSDFAFLSRQKRMDIDGRDYYLDLLFYHRRLRCLVAIEIKLGEFEAAYKGQMELYLRWLEKHEMVKGEDLPIGLILCSGKTSEHIELMQLNESNIRVAEYLVKLPSVDVLEEKLRQSINLARRKLNEQNSTQ